LIDTGINSSFIKEVIKLCDTVLASMAYFSLISRTQQSGISVLRSHFFLFCSVIDPIRIPTFSVACFRIIIPAHYSPVMTFFFFGFHLSAPISLGNHIGIAVCEPGKNYSSTETFILSHDNH